MRVRRHGRGDGARMAAVAPGQVSNLPLRIASVGGSFRIQARRLTEPQSVRERQTRQHCEPDAARSYRAFQSIWTQTLNLRRTFIPALVGMGLIFAIACGSDGAVSLATIAPSIQAPVSTATSDALAPTQTATTQVSSAEPEGPAGPPPALDTAIRSVELDQVVFDTFDGGSVRLSVATPELVDRLRDAIQPIYTPVYDDVSGGDWMGDDDLVLGYEAGGQAFAYPIKMLNFHELVNDIIDGVPVLITYCPLCGSGVVYDRRVGDETLLFGNTSALYENDLVMFDYNSGSYWFQTAAEAIVGVKTGTRLDPLPATTITWSTWVELHPNTRVLARRQPEISRAPNYDRDPFAGGAYEARIDDLQFPFPVDTDALDRRLRASEIAISLRVGGAEKAYPLARIGDAVLNDEFIGQPVVVFSQSRGPSGNGFLRTVGSRVLTFTQAGDVITDDETGSTWDFFGRAIAGELRGEMLELITARRAFWFSLAAAVPGIELWEGTCRTGTCREAAEEVGAR